MKTKTTITVEKWEYTAVRLKREPVVATCPVCGGDVDILSAETADRLGISEEHVRELIEKSGPHAASEATKYLCLKSVAAPPTENRRNEKRQLRLRPLNQQ